MESKSQIRNPKSKARRIAGLLLICTVGALITTGCGKARKAGGEMDTPQAHYRQGMKYFNENQTEKAEDEFRLALSLDKKFGPGYAGLALTSAAKFRASGRQDLADKAKDFFNKAKDLDGRNAATWIAGGRVVMLLKAGRTKDRDWWKDARKRFDRALDLSPSSAEAFYWRAMCYRAVPMFNEAEADFAKVLDLNAGYTAQASEQWKILQDIKRAARSENGKRLALLDQLSRADLCVLFVDELDIARYVQRRAPAAPDLAFQAPQDPRAAPAKTAEPIEPSDIADHWARNFILDMTALDLRGIEPGPDGKVYPDSLINRGEFALLTEDVLSAMLKEDIRTRHIGGTARFRDLASTHPYFNALCNMVDRGFLKTDVHSFIQPLSTVSGVEALLIIRQLRDLDRNFGSN